MKVCKFSADFKYWEWEFQIGKLSENGVENSQSSGWLEKDMKAETFWFIASGKQLSREIMGAVLM